MKKSTVICSEEQWSGAAGEEGVPGSRLGLMLTTMALLAFGLTMLYSASSGDIAKAALFFRNQLIWAGVGCMLGVTAFFLGYRFLAEKSLIWVAGISVLLVWAMLSRPVNGAHRWIHLGGYTFQPSELAKVAVALFTAWYCSAHPRTFTQWSSRRGMIPLAATAGCVILLILAGHDLGTTVLVSLTCFLTLMAAGLHWLYLAVPLAIAPVVVGYLYKFDEMRWLRMTVFTDPETYQQGSGYQLWNSILALGSGNWGGVGLMSSRLKAQYLPEAHTDFILAIVGEELGFIGLCSVLLLYTLWGVFALRITLHARDRLGMLLGWALTLGVLLQAAINFGAMSGVFPTKGMPAPFISYGGSNLLGCLLATGILVSISQEAIAPGYAGRIRNKFTNIFKRSGGEDC